MDEDVTVVNVVATGELDTDVHLERLYDAAETPVVDYDSVNHQGLYLRFEEEGPLITAQRVWRVMDMGILERGNDTRVWKRSFTAALLLDYHHIGEVEWDDENEWMLILESDDNNS